MAYLKVGDENSTPIELYYEDHGKGQPVVLIHGFPLNGASWEKQEVVLLNNGYRVITYDRRGFGKSSQPTSDYNYDTFVDDLNVLMTRLDLKNVILVGFSMGTGEVARYLSHFGSSRVYKAVMISPIPPFLLKTSDNLSGIDVSFFDGIQKEILEDRPAYLEKFLKTFYNYDTYAGTLVSENVLLANFIVASAASAVATHDCVFTWMTDFRKDLSLIKVPLLIIQGDADKILPLAATGALIVKAVKNAKLVVIKGGPHAICWTHADDVNSELLEFISSETSDLIKQLGSDRSLGIS